MITLSEKWKNLQPAAKVGVLSLERAKNSSVPPTLTAAQEELESELRECYEGMDRAAIRELAVFSAYDAFCKGFRKTYHVQLQVESVAFQGKSIRSPSALVCCMFMAELKTGLLTAGHDRAFLELPLVADVASGTESFQRLDGANQTLKEGDLYIRDQQGILSSVIYGPDHRTRIRKDTDRVVFTTYAPGGISEEQIMQQLLYLEGLARQFAPDLSRELLRVL